MNSRKATLLVVAVSLVGAIAVVTVGVAGDKDAEKPRAGLGCGKTGTPVATTPPAKPGCAKPGAATADLNEAERKVLDYVVQRIVEEGGVQFSEEAVLEATGVDKTELRESVLGPALIAELQRRDVDVTSLTGGGYCSKFAACSVDRNLNNATGEELVRYKKEKAEDGVVYADRQAPDFRLPATDGATVALSDYRGKDVAVVFLSAHCYHSLDTLPILAELRDKYAAEGLEILPIFVNSGTPEDVKSRAWELDVPYRLLVSESKDVTKAYDSRMVPATFLIDEEGRITKKLVGFKDKPTLDAALAELARS